MKLPEYRKLIKKPKASKYNNTKVNGYASRKESQRAATLQLLQKAGIISFLQEQAIFELIPSQYRDGKCVERSCKYVADFTYYKDDIFVVEDVKSPITRTAEYIIKRKLMLHVHGIQILET